MSPQLLVDSRGALALPAPDAAAALAVALLAVASGRRGGLHLGAALVALSALSGAAFALWPLFRDRPFELDDVLELPGLPHLLLGVSPTWWAASLLALPVVLGLHLLAWWGLSRLARTGGRRGLLLWCAGLQAIVVLGAVGVVPWHGSALGALSRDTARALRGWLGFHGAGGALSAPPGAERLAAAPRDLRGLAGADVHVLFLESYGRAALRHPEIGGSLRALWPALENELMAAGFVARSGACTPAVSGGGSLWAHAQLFSGTRVSNPRTWERLQHCGLRPLPWLFADAGYHTVETMPAMDRHWPVGAAFFGFAEQVTALELGYAGFHYHFGAMPDQYALHHVLRHVVEPATKPLFTTYVSVTSHLPCSSIPPYVADWQITPATFSGEPAVRYDISWFNARSSPDIVPAYRDAVVYSLRAAVGFTARLTRPSVVVVLGDHQPPIKTVLVPGDQSYDVPLHVMTNRSGLGALAESLGLVAGLDVPDELAAFDSTEFAPAFLRAFSRPE